MKNQELGSTGETLAINLLRNKGHEIVETNYRIRRGELDIISRYNDKIVITEVKTRFTDELGAPYLAVNKSKQRQIIKLANLYIQEKDVREEIQFDVISIVLNANRKFVEHIEDAFYPLI